MRRRFRMQFYFLVRPIPASSRSVLEVKVSPATTTTRASSVSSQMHEEMLTARLHSHSGDETIRACDATAGSSLVAIAGFGVAREGRTKRYRRSVYSSATRQQPQSDRAIGITL